MAERDASELGERNRATLWWAGGAMALAVAGVCVTLLGRSWAMSWAEDWAGPGLTLAGALAWFSRRLWARNR